MDDVEVWIIRGTVQTDTPSQPLSSMPAQCNAILNQVIKKHLCDLENQLKTQLSYCRAFFIRHNKS